jgi:hypothetical protein
VLQPPSLLAPWPVGPEHPCAKCGTFVAGIPIGGLCPDCTLRLRRRAARIARWVAMGTTLPLAGYVAWTLPHDKTARLVGAAAVLIWYALTTLIARRVAWEWIK